MKSELLEKLRCPVSRLPLRVDDGELVSEDGRHRYPIRNGIPRFVPESNYADNFGMQWNHFSKTQLDSHSGHPISADRFWKATGWQPEQIKDHWVLDVGCGAGRFAEVALSAGAKVVALDYSSAVDASCYANLQHHPNLHVVQGDIYALPFAPESFPFVYSLGVLQHTPDVAKAFAALPPMVAGGGGCAWTITKNPSRACCYPSIGCAPLTRLLPKARLFSVLQTLVPVLLPVSRGLGAIPIVGKLLKRLVPVANYAGILPLNEQQLREAFLDTFDWLAPEYDQPQTAETVYRWMEQAGMQQVEVLKAGHLVTRAGK